LFRQSNERRSEISEIAIFYRVFDASYHAKRPNCTVEVLPFFSPLPFLLREMQQIITFAVMRLLSTNSSRVLSDDVERQSEYSINITIHVTRTAAYRFRNYTYC